MQKNGSFISVIICTYNRCESLKDTLISLLSQKRDGRFEYEIIVVDNNSKDKTNNVVESYKPKFNGRLRYIFESNQGLSYARNRGIKEAKGDIIAFTDDDAIVADDWLFNIYNAFERYDPLIVGGKTLLKLDAPIPGWLSKEISATLGKCDKGEKIIYADEQYEDIVGIGANISFKKDVFANFGLFKAELSRTGKKLLMGDETEIYRKVKNAGGKCMYHPDIIAYHCITNEKLNKNYFRRYYYRMGQWLCFSDSLLSKKITRRMFGIPQWKFKKAIKNLFGLFWHTLKGSEPKAFYSEINLYSFFGYCTKKAGLSLWKKRK